MGLSKKWDKSNQDENEYSAQYMGENNTIVLDRVTADNIELCDILSWDSQSVYLYHIKAEFGNKMRDLSGQISIAAHRLARDSENNFVREIYGSLKAKKGPDPYFEAVGKQANKISEQQFCELFNGSRKIVFVMSILDIRKDRKLVEIEKFNSNIAKFSLQELAKRMRIFDDFQLEVAQIFPPSK
jgi:hypothetical protein